MLNESDEILLDTYITNALLTILQEEMRGLKRTFPNSTLRYEFVQMLNESGILKQNNLRVISMEEQIWQKLKEKIKKQPKKSNGCR